MLLTAKKIDGCRYGIVFGCLIIGTSRNLIKEVPIFSELRC